MNNLPHSVLEELIQSVLKETSAAWLSINSDGILVNMGGALTTFGLGDIEKGCIIQQQAVFLEGILSMEDFNDKSTFNIESIQIDNGKYADVHLIEKDNIRWLILLGRTESSIWKGIAQQKTNDLRLLQDKLSGNNNEESDSTQIDFSSLMGLIALEQNEDEGSFRLLEPIPCCSSSIYPETNKQNNNLHPENDFPFLANFLEDCNTVWQGEKDERLKSGPWIEESESGEEYVLEATAVLWQQRKILLIEHLSSDYDDHLAILQLGRENVLNRQKLEKELLHQQKMEQSLIEARAKADNANNAKSEFLSSMSHELRTPLNSILGFSQLMLNNSDDEQTLTEEQRESLGYIVSSGSHLLELISQVLELSKIEAGEMALSIDDIAVNDVIESCIPIIQVLADKQQITIRWKESTNAIVRADYMRLKQVIINLLNNAVKYNNLGGLIDIEESITEQGNFRIAIRDNGIGIPANKFDKLFTAFSRLGQGNSKIEGAGVGLVVTKTIVDAMNGQLGFESVEGEGSTFWVEFPLAVGYE